MYDLRLIPESYLVFGSNLSGIHGAGAARTAHEKWGAECGVGEGLTGRAYALPTKEKDVATTRSADDILLSIAKFVNVALTNPDKLFIVTPVGCGLAGLREENVMSLIREAGGPSRNMLFTASWLDPKVF